MSIHHPITRISAAALVAVGLLLATALPAAAADVRLDATGGAVTFGTAGLPVPFGHATSNTCAANSLQDHLIPDITGGVITLDPTDYNLHETDFSFGANQVRMQLIAGGATTTGSVSGSIIVLTVNLRLVIKTCSGTTTLCTTNPFSATLSTTAYSGSTPPVTSDTATLTGTTTGNVTAPLSCNTIFRSIINNQTASITLNVHVP